MKHENLLAACRTLALGAVLFIGSMATLSPRVLAQGSAPLTITAPASGTTFAPGQSVTVSVSIASGTYPNGLAVIAQDPLGATAIQPVTGSSMSFSLTIPTNAPPGNYKITSTGPNSAGVLIMSAPISVVVQRPDMPTALSVHPSMIFLRYVGDTLPLTVFGTFSDGSVADVTQTTQLTVNSENASVAVAQNGIVTAVNSGQTYIDLQYGSVVAKISVSVPTAIRGDLNGDGKVDKSDVAIITDARNTPANGPNDARDLNHDGIINVLDARIDATLCTYSGCATQ